MKPMFVVAFACLGAAVLSVSGVVYVSASTIVPVPSTHHQALTPAFRQVSTGYGTTCGIRASLYDGTGVIEPGGVQCWGDLYGGSANPASGAFKQVSAGDEISCGLKTGGKVTCWGTNQEHLAMKLPKGTFSQISEGSVIYSTGEDQPVGCGVTVAGKIDCWSVSGNPSQWIGTPPSGTFTQISVGQSLTWQTTFACALRSSGSIVCFGNNDQGELKAPSGTFRQVSAGQGWACGLRTNGTVACWGEIIPASNGSKAIYPKPPVSAKFSEIGGLCGVRTNGQIACWDGMTDVPYGTFTEVGGGFEHMNHNPYTRAFLRPEYCGLETNGQIECWQSYN